MEIVKWEFPNFEAWCENEHSWYGSIGDYNCSIDIFSWSKDNNTHICAISTSNIPSNIYVNTVVRYTGIVKRGDIDELREWYNQTIEKTQLEWAKYINKTYITNQ